MIELIDVCKAFHEGQPNEYLALNHVSLNLPRGSMSVLHGPSGSGKTTLLTLLGCMARPTSGRVRMDGQDISSLPERFLARLRRERIGFVFQQFNLIAGMSARANVMLPAYPDGPAHRGLLDRADALLEQLNLAHRRDALVQTLSGGEQQRVAIARALINQPEVLIADEPTANLDSHLAQECLEILGRLHAEQGVTVIIASHDPLVLHHPGVQMRVALRDGRVQAVNMAQADTIAPAEAHSPEAV